MLSTGLVEARDVGFDERVRAQAAIERVYWSHRVWPHENSSTRPTFSESVPERHLRAKVDDYLAKSTALAARWNRRIGPQELQEELNRMARSTRDGAVLAELFAALGDDAELIAETLARPVLVERLIRDLYRADVELHGSIRRAAEAALATCGGVDCLKTNGEDYQETTWRVGNSAGSPLDSRVLLDRADWVEHLEHLRWLFGGDQDSLPLRSPSSLQENDEAFYVTVVLAQATEEMTEGTRVWRKVPFSTWWQRERGRFRTIVPEAPASMRYVLPAISGTPCTPDSWIPTTIPEKRKSHTAVWTGAEMIVWGGEHNGYAVRQDGSRYDPATDTWVATSTVGAPQGRGFHTAVWTGSEMIVWGGYGWVGEGTSSILQTGGRYDPVSDTWTPTSTSAGVPAARQQHHALWTGTEMLVWGGNVGEFQAWLNTGGRYNPASDTWTPTSQVNAPEARYAPCVVWAGSELIVWGGRQDVSPFAHLQTGGRYRPDLDAWTPTPVGPTTPDARVSATAVWTGSEVIVWGGVSASGGRLNSGGRFDLVANSWSATSVGTNVPVARERHTAIWTGSEMIVWGGYRGSVPYLNTGGRYDPSTDSWTATSVGAGAPVGRYAHTVIWTGTEMVVWGGAIGGSDPDLNSGGRYGPTTNSWTPTSTGGTVPSPRADHSAVWTGAEMIVWGGRNDTTYFNTGGRYIPALDTWQPTGTGPNVPSGRSDHTAIWTGTEMIVWGGRNGSTYTGSGARYDPATDTWTATSSGAGVPASRGFHSAVWTGTWMIVWGGYSPPDSVNGGALYDPVSDAWIPTSTGPGVPEPRSLHTAVWTGEEMIVWGGSSTAELLGTGGRYDPTTDSWMTTATGVNAPSPRLNHTAVWTGTEMIVWGGTDDTKWGVNSGARYAPASDTWTPTATGIYLPEGRQRHTAVWTGSEMVIWGGSGDNWLTTGGRYDPVSDAWTPTSTEGNVPGVRESHTAVWTGNAMIVWSGRTPWDYVTSWGCYCLADCLAPGVYFQDTDGDRFGDLSIWLQACHAPDGYVTMPGDCDDRDENTYPGAAERKDGRDNQCAGDGFGAVDEISGPTGWDDVTFSWTAQVDATSYEVARSSTPSFTEECAVLGPMSAPEVADPSLPAPGAGFFYVVRSIAPGPPGSWGQTSTGAERTMPCLP